MIAIDVGVQIGFARSCYVPNDVRRVFITAHNNRISAFCEVCFSYTNRHDATKRSHQHAKAKESVVLIGIE
jgi:hypothetical protein